MGGRERDPGEVLDRLLDEHELHFDSRFDPRAWRRRRRRGPGYALGAAAAAAALLAAAAYGHVSRLPLALAPASRTASVQPDPWARLGLVAQSSLPVWAVPHSRPWQETLYTGHATVKGFPADVVVAVRSGPESQLAVGFENNQPVWYANGTDPVPVAQDPVTGSAAGYWVSGGLTPLSSFSAAGQDVYITHGAEWALLTGAMDVHWAMDPGAAALQSQVAALPAEPARALLLTESPTGTEQLYLRTSRSGVWQPDSMPAAPITQLVALGHQFWALADGTLYLSSDGVHWQARYQAPQGFSVATFAVGQHGSRILAAVSLAPTGQAGMGPVLLSRNDGRGWHNIGLPWPNGTAPTQMVVTPQGRVAALLLGPPAVLEEWKGTGAGWSLIPLPQPNTSGVGQLTAFANGDLLYADNQGALFRWQGATQTWLTLPAPPGRTNSTPTLLMAIGTHQVLVSYPDGWWVLVLKPAA